MSDLEMSSIVLAWDHHVTDAERMWSLIAERQSHLAGIGARHVVMYSAVSEPNRVLVTIGIRQRCSVEELLRSPAVFEWFDLAGVEDIPALFVGEVLEKIDVLGEASGDTHPGVIVGVVTTIDDVADLIAKVHRDLHLIASVGVRKIWIYGAVDDGQEVLILQDIGSEHKAWRWTDYPDELAAWMSGPRPGPYPPVFVGKVAHVMNVEATH